ncbi:hypothetical protein A6U97_26525 [Agrobacterium tumefaciens]|uniref:hypothetical protein n=1 Tax=Agrobacterium tumefaciens TaxID=358 RepID=UPI00080FB59C|nr:hypothetical protein A6U97_26525 [Agrobacterium tumefaciens]
MQRRNFLIGSLALGAHSMAPRSANAYTQCMPHPQFGQVCESGINLSQIVTAFGTQKLNQWCWAASVQMAFANYGYSVAQERIVENTYGIIGNIPAVTGYAISKNLQGDWVDDNGTNFSVEIAGLYDYDAGIMGITDQDIVQALDEEHPIIMGTANHAVLLVSVAYVPSPIGPKVTNIGLADPFPGIGLRGPQSPADMVAMHLGGNLRYLCLPRVY